MQQPAERGCHDGHDLFGGDERESPVREIGQYLVVVSVQRLEQTVDATIIELLGQLPKERPFVLFEVDGGAVKRRRKDDGFFVEKIFQRVHQVRFVQDNVVGGKAIGENDEEYVPNDQQRDEQQRRLEVTPPPVVYRAGGQPFQKIDQTISQPASSAVARSIGAMSDVIVEKNDRE